MVSGMKQQRPRFSGRLLLPCLLVISAMRLLAQEPIGRTTATEVKVSGAVDISHGETLLGNGSNITAENEAVKITLQRGGSLQLCSTSNVYLAKDGSVQDRPSGALLIALGHGAIEASYKVGTYSDVLMTPDLRILISGPGDANLNVRVNTKGDTCVDNHGVNAPYVTVSSQLEGGAYRVMPNQRVSFQHGSLLEVVDHEPEPCGCPVTPANSLAQGGSSGTVAGHPVGGPSSTAADTAFPIAESEGLAPVPQSPTTPVVPAGQAHAQLSVPLEYDGEAPAAAAPPPATGVAAPANTSPAPAASPAPSASVASTAENPPQATAPPPSGPLISRPPGGGNIFHSIGHFFAKIFGG